ncbi:MAG: 1-(5-phosphoribosyl)-5-[(5-phosphoribosylamino)methylideneamino]imidazole-4-carboxamide isomerase [Bacteroidota bacterium]|nr:1-(5-phosphoribosyl)-5-[(5-phosphoribosylamino)methylideneamino]imidazole-4-carboxamide isomerase [Bacteroidota bacterium]
MEIIPALDIIDGKCVRLQKGDFTKKMVYHDDPLEAAKKFEDAGLLRLHIVDLDGANGQGLKNLKTLENISKNTSLVIDFGGGLKNTSDITSVFNAGASMVSVGSVIIKNPELFAQWIMDFGPEKFLPGADVLDKKIKIHGWKEETGISVFDFIKNMIAKGILQVFCTDISKDGMMQGPSTDLYKEILNNFPSLHLIASGGIACFDDLVILKKSGCKGAIVGKAFYEGKITMKQIEGFLKN